MTDERLEITIDPDVRRRCPGLALGVVSGFAHVTDDDGALWGEIERCIADLRTQLTLDRIAQEPPVQALRRGYRALGKDPTRYRGSQESLLRRVLKGLDLYRVNTIVDVGNLVSLESRRSLGCYDRERLAGALVYRTGRTGETYRGIGRDVLNLEDMPLLADELGPFGSPTSDSERASVTVATSSVLIVVHAFDGADALAPDLARVTTLLRAHAHGHDLETMIVT